jgi:hypothetical protein
MLGCALFFTFLPAAFTAGVSVDNDFAGICCFTFLLCIFYVGVFLANDLTGILSQEILGCALFFTFLPAAFCASVFVGNHIADLLLHLSPLQLSRDFAGITSLQ